MIEKHTSHNGAFKLAKIFYIENAGSIVGENANNNVDQMPAFYRQDTVIIVGQMPAFFGKMLALSTAKMKSIVAQILLVFSPYYRIESGYNC